MPEMMESNAIAEILEDYMIGSKRPWQHLVNEDEDEIWAGFSAWEAWLCDKLGEEAAEGYEDAGDIGCWKEYLYSVFIELLNSRTYDDLPKED